MRRALHSQNIALALPERLAKTRAMGFRPDPSYDLG